jgi:hypothetical protein
MFMLKNEADDENNATSPKNKTKIKNKINDDSDENKRKGVKIGGTELRKNLWIPDDARCPPVWFLGPQTGTEVGVGVVPSIQVRRGPYRVTGIHGRNILVIYCWTVLYLHLFFVC